MRSNQLEQAQHPVSPDETARMIASLQASQLSPIQNQDQANSKQMMVTALRQPATRQWISGRVATVLSQYFASSVPTEVMTAIAEDWFDELGEYPSWALQKACRWGMSADNEKRRQKPLPGDIAARAREEMACVRMAERALRKFNPKPTGAGQPDDERPRVSSTAASDILAKAGFNPKRFGS